MKFSMKERTALDALAKAAFPAGARAPAVRDDLLDRVDRFLTQSPAEAILFLRMVLFLVEWGAVLFYGSRFSKLPGEKAEQYIEAWSHHSISPLRLYFRALISPLKIVHYGQPEVARALGYDPPAETACAHPQPTPLLKPRKAEGTLRCEVAVIGSGAGGATIAKELAELGHDVVVLEEGEYVESRRFNRRPLDMSALLYRDLGMTMALGRSTGIPVPLGKSVGGTTTINSGTCFRVPDHVLERWSQDGDLRVSPQELSPHFDRVEQFIEVTQVPEGVLGNDARGGGGGGGGAGAPRGRGGSVERSARTGAGKRVQPGPLTVEADAVVVSAGTLHTPSLL